MRGTSTVALTSSLQHGRKTARRQHRSHSGTQAPRTSPFHLFFSLFPFAPSQKRRKEETEKAAESMSLSFSSLSLSSLSLSLSLLSSLSLLCAAVLNLLWPRVKSLPLSCPPDPLQAVVQLGPLSLSRFRSQPLLPHTLFPPSSASGQSTGRRPCPRRKAALETETQRHRKRLAAVGTARRCWRRRRSLSRRRSERALQQRPRARRPTSASRLSRSLSWRYAAAAVPCCA